ncbi:MAG: methyltransferase domain-containing protein [Thermoanaerobaculia bacterium]
MSSFPSSEPTYIHGSLPREQRRLSVLNELLNSRSLAALDVRFGDRVLDLGSGLGQLSRGIARAVGRKGRVVAIERDPGQLAAAVRLAAAEGEDGLVDFRAGSVAAPPLDGGEWGTFDVAHARFVLEHLSDPRAAVALLARAVRPGGRIVLEDDDHSLLRVHPRDPDLERLWDAYVASYERLGNDPRIGTRLTGLLVEVGAEPRRSDMLFFGACRGARSFEPMIGNFRGVLEGARQSLLDTGSASEPDIERGLAAFDRWRGLADAALWYVTCWAEGVRPGS